MRLARDQHGVVARWQLARLGLPDTAIGRLVARGVLRRAHRGVYVVAGAPPSFRQRAMVGVLAAGGLRDDGNVVAVARRSAAHLLGVRHDEPVVVQVVVDHARTPTHGGGVRFHRSSTLRPEDVAWVDGIPVTRGSRTCADLAMTHPLDFVVEVTAVVLQRRLSDLGELSDQFARAGNIRGAGKLRVALARLAADSDQAESVPEERVWRVIVEAGLPAPTRQHEVVDDAGRRRRFDLAWPWCDLAVEVDGYWWHSRPGAKLRDDTRTNALSGRWRILRFSPGHSDAYILATVRAALPR